MTHGSANEELFRALVREWNDGDRDGIRSRMGPETEVHTRLGQLRGRPYVGLAGFDEWMADIDEQFSGFRLDLDRVEEVEPGRLLATGSIEFRGRGSDLKMVQETVWELHIDEGRVDRMEIRTGLDEQPGMRGGS